MIQCLQQVEPKKFIPVDKWVPTEKEMIILNVKGALIMPINSIVNSQKDSIDYFVLSTKRCYNSDEVRNHICHYLNYFENFYDNDRELLMVYANIKTCIDCYENYDKEMFFKDINRYIFKSTIRFKIWCMNEENYCIDLGKTIKRKQENLKYDNNHGKILMEIGLLQLIVIPLLTHFMYVKGITAVDDFLLSMYDKILDLFDVDMYNKLYETASTNIKKHQDCNIIWSQQDIRGINTTTHSVNSVETILLNIMCKYVYNQEGSKGIGNPVTYNFKSIDKNTKYKITHIQYEYDFSPLDSSNRDAENNSEFDKFESYLSKKDEGLFLENQVNAKTTMERINNQFGPFYQDEIDFYIQQLSVNGEFIMNSKQKEWVLYIFYKYFGDPAATKAINRNDYIKLIIASKKILESSKLYLLPRILSSKFSRLNTRKSVNKTDSKKIENSQFFKLLQTKYLDPKIIDIMNSMIATMCSSEFISIDYDVENHCPGPTNGQVIDIVPERLREELLIYGNLI